MANPGRLRTKSSGREAQTELAWGSVPEGLLYGGRFLGKALDGRKAGDGRAVDNQQR